GYWLHETGLPVVKCGPVRVEAPAVASADKSAAASSYRVIGELQRDGKGVGSRIDVTVETAKGETTKTIALDGPSAGFSIETAEKPLRLVVDKYQTTAKSNGSAFALQAFYGERDRTLIVYGTQDEEAANRETAKALQDLIRTRWSNDTLPIKADKDV